MNQPDDTRRYRQSATAGIRKAMTMLLEECNVVTVCARNSTFQDHAKIGPNATIEFGARNFITKTVASVAPFSLVLRTSRPDRVTARVYGFYGTVCSKGRCVIRRLNRDENIACQTVMFVAPGQYVNIGAEEGVDYM